MVMGDVAAKVMGFARAQPILPDTNVACGSIGSIPACPLSQQLFLGADFYLAWVARWGVGRRPYSRVIERRVWRRAAMPTYHGAANGYAFDTLGYAKPLRDSGVGQAQAEAHAEAARDFVMGQLVTQQDLQAAVALTAQDLKAGVALLDNKLVATQHDLQTAITQLDNKLVATQQDLRAAVALLDNKLDTLSLRLTVRLGAMLVVSIGLLATILKLMP